jgi:hypothetical protein
MTVATLVKLVDCLDLELNISISEKKTSLEKTICPVEITTPSSEDTTIYSPFINTANAAEDIPTFYGGNRRASV